MLVKSTDIEQKGMTMSTQTIAIGVVIAIVYIVIALVVANLTPTRAMLRARNEAITWLTAMLFGSLVVIFATLMSASQEAFTVLPNIVDVAIPGMVVALIIIALWVLCLIYGFRFTDNAAMKSNEIVKAESAKAKSSVKAKTTKKKDSDVVPVDPEDFLGTRTDTPKTPSSSEVAPPSYVPYHAK